MEAEAGGTGAVVIHLIGDSTMSVRPGAAFPPSFGWGQVLAQYFDDDVVIRNHARSGRSTKSFVDEGLWALAHDEMQPGDYLIIQFGRNDQKTDRPDLYADPETYKEYLRRFVQSARDKGVEPILATPLARRRFDPQGRFRDSMGDYPAAVRELALEAQVALLDLHRESEALLSSLGPEGSKALVWWIEPGVHAALPEGKQDNSHLSEAGANRVCQLAASLLRQQNTPLADYLKDPV